MVMNVTGINIAKWIAMRILEEKSCKVSILVIVRLLDCSGFRL